MINRLVAARFRRPTGLFGQIVGNMMAKGNEHECRWTVSVLDIQPKDRVLEVGFGPGVAVQYAAQKAVEGLVVGIDYSETMVRAARKRNAAAVKCKRVDLKHGEVSSLPYQDGSFDKAFAIHCLYFWAEPIGCLKELRRVLKPNGLAAITILPKDNWQEARMPPLDLFTLYHSNEVAELLSDAGFREVHIEVCPQSDKFSGACVLGRK